MQIDLVLGAPLTAAHSFARRVVLPLLLAVASSTAVAQQPVVFVHGIQADGSTWSQTAERLQREYNVTTNRPSTPSGSVFENQSSSLIGQVAGLPANTIAVGHSNGGLVSREANEDGRPWRGIVTIGTLHTGAPLAQSVLNGQVYEQARYIVNSIAAPLIHYSYFYPDDWWWAIAGRLGNWAASVGLAMPMAVANVGFAIANPVLPQMVPGSAFLNHINAGGNLAREAGALERRVSISSTVPSPFGLFFQGVAPDRYKTYGALQYLAGTVFLAAGLYYQEFVGWDDPWWYEKQAGAYLWFYAAEAMFNLDQDWCYLIGAYAGNGNCYENDGIVPSSRMPYVGGTRNVHIVGPAHTQETRDGYVPIAQVLREDFGVTPPPGSAFTSLAISGPFNIGGCQTGVWTATPTGGSPPITYTWTAEGQSMNTGTSNKLYYTNLGSAWSIFVRATATDSRGVVLSSSSFKTNVSMPGSC